MLLEWFRTSKYFRFVIIILILSHIFADNKAAIGLLKLNKLTYRSRHADIPIAFCYENYLLGYFKFHHISTKLNAVNSSTKPTTGPILQRFWEFLRGYCLYPSLSTLHGSYLHTTPSHHTILDSGKWYLCLSIPPS